MNMKIRLKKTVWPAGKILFKTCYLEKLSFIFKDKLVNMKFIFQKFKTLSLLSLNTVIEENHYMISSKTTYAF